MLCNAIRPNPDPRAIEWLRRNESNLAIDPVILGEVRFGILLLPSGKWCLDLQHWFDEVIAHFHCLPRDAEAGSRWAELLAHLRSIGRPMPIKDSLIAATLAGMQMLLALKQSPLLRLQRGLVRCNRRPSLRHHGHQAGRSEYSAVLWDLDFGRPGV